jgi:hypothetical protein
MKQIPIINAIACFRTIKSNKDHNIMTSLVLLELGGSHGRVDSFLKIKMEVRSVESTNGNETGAGVFSW